MSIFNLISLLGGLAMFLYGMRMMGDGLKEGSSGKLKQAMEKLTNTPVKAFLLGVATTAVIQSSTATIVITSGLVGAGIISLHQSLGIIIGANVGTTVTGQIIRLLDINASGTSVLQFFKPSTLAPLALIIGILLIMGFKFKGSDEIGRVMIGFGILFSGLLNMTDAVSTLTETGIVEKLFTHLGENPVIGYSIGALVAFVLQSSSASIGILQAFSTSGQLTFGAIYAVLVGIYLGDCVTTAIVCNIGAKAEAKRVGIVNIVFNLSKSLAILVVVNVLYQMGFLSNLWNSVIYSGGIANTNTAFNLACAVVLFPAIPLFEKLSHKLVKDDINKDTVDKYDELTDSLNPVFLSTPAFALDRCYDVLKAMLDLAYLNLNKAFNSLTEYDEKVIDEIEKDENHLDNMADRISNYLIQVSEHLTSTTQVESMNYYYSITTEFERLGDHATNIAEIAMALKANDTVFSKAAVNELMVLRELIERVQDYTREAFENKNLTAAKHIEPLEEVVDDMVSALKDNHLERLKEGTCGISAGTNFLNLLAEIERISDVCSNIGVDTVARVKPELKHQVHDYVSMLHAGTDEEFNREYKEAHERYFRLMRGFEGETI